MFLLSLVEAFEHITADMSGSGYKVK